MKQRLDKNADEFSNKDLMTLMSAVQTVLDRRLTDQQEGSMPTIAVQQNVVNIGADKSGTFTKEQRDRIKGVVDMLKGEMLLQEQNDKTNTF